MAGYIKHNSLLYQQQFVLFVLVFSVQILISIGSVKTFRERFTRNSSMRLSAIPERQIFNTTVETCAERCVKETGFHCKSFDVDNVRKRCILYTVDREDLHVTLIEDSDRDHYGGAFARLFDVTPGHQLYTWMDLALMDVSVEQCARICILETSFKCQSFNYISRDKTCKLTERMAIDSHGIVDSPLEDYYRRKPESDLVHFINFGQRALKQMTEINVYQGTFIGITLAECATKCLEQTKFHCASFDYVHESGSSKCRLSQYIAANVYGLREVDNLRINHYERIEEDMTYFYATPYSILLGNNRKTYKYIMPNRCARNCMTEEAFICRSFDYQISEGTCTLSDKTGSDVGGLYYEGTDEVHHFEMKPLLVCGGNLSDPRGDFASPNWPRNYAHHERCDWNITVAKNKVITFTFLRVDFGLQSGDPCNKNDDRLVIQELDSSQCVTPNTKTITSETNSVTVSFFSNSQVDAQGFRVFYQAEWTCDAHMNDSPGDFASPKWPNDYPPATQCSWRITAPPGNRIRLYFTSFQLEEHELGHCRDDLDNVKILDGGTINSPKIALFCGKRSAFMIKSSGTDMFITFHSDQDRVSQGFHATYVFEPALDEVVVSEPKLPEKGSPVDLDKGRLKTESKEDTGDEGKILIYYDKHQPTPGSSEQDDESSEENSVESGSNEDKNNKQAKVNIAGEKDSVSGGVVASSHDNGHVGHKEYKTAMWAIITLLIIMLIALSVVLFLVWRHYERKLRHFGEIIREENDMTPEEVPLQMTTFNMAKQNNELELLGNEVDVCGGGTGMGVFIPSSSGGGACGGSDTGGGAGGGDSNINNFGKYTKENIKNVNLDTKYTADDGYNEKCNLTVNMPSKYA